MGDNDGGGNPKRVATYSAAVRQQTEGENLSNPPSSGRNHRRVNSEKLKEDNAKYLKALTSDTTCKDIIKNLPKYTDPRVLRIEDRLKNNKLGLTFDRIFGEPTGYYLFCKFLDASSNHTRDKALFLKDVQAYGAMRFEKARLKVARLIFFRYIAQTPLTQDQQEEKGKKKNNKKKKKKNDKSIQLRREVRSSVFDAIKKKNAERALGLSNSTGRSFSMDEKKGANGDEMKSRQYSPRFSISEFEVDSDTFEVGVENDIGLYGESVKHVATSLSESSAPRDLFHDVEKEVRDMLIRDAYPDFLASMQYQKYMRTKVLEERRVGPEDFEVLRILGKGGFGVVYAVMKKDSGKLYAMKLINKKLIKHKKAVAMTMLERHTLSLVHSRFVCGLHYAFQDKTYLYLVMDLMAGGDLKFHLTRSRATSRANTPRLSSRTGPDSQNSKAPDTPKGNPNDNPGIGNEGSGRSLLTVHGGFPVERAVFHGAEILLGLEAMHAKNIIFRDLKLENVLLDDNGHCKITDLGLVALYGRKKVSHYAGTPGYIAPEVAQKKNYSTAVDLFSFGVTLYRMLSGKKPFKGNSRQDFDRAVCNDEPDYDSEVFSNDAIDLIQGLLQKDPKKRLGTGKGRSGIQAIKDHPFFSSIDWGLLEVGYITPPFIPNRMELYANVVAEVDPEEEAKNPYNKIQLDEKFRKQIIGFDYTSKHAVRKEIVEALQKEEEEDEQSKTRKSESGSTECCVIL